MQAYFSIVTNLKVGLFKIIFNFLADIYNPRYLLIIATVCHQLCTLFWLNHFLTMPNVCTAGYLVSYTIMKAERDNY